MSNLLRALAATAALTLAYCATSVWAHALPLTVPALVTSGVCMLVFHFTSQLLRTHDATPAPACPVHGDTVACPCALAAVTFDTLPLDRV
jgi:hypothetical protein